MRLLFHYSHPLKILIQSLKSKSPFHSTLINIHLVHVIHPTFLQIYIYLPSERLNVRFSFSSNSLFFPPPLFNLNIRSTRCCGEIACSTVCTQITRQADIIDVRAHIYFHVVVHFYRCPIPFLLRAIQCSRSVSFDRTNGTTKRIGDDLIDDDRGINLYLYQIVIV